MAIVLAWPQFHHAVREITLPLRHEDIIRQQAHDKGLDPALIAAVIYAESHFRDGQTSAAGAQGLMQLTPATARYIAHKSGGTQFVVDDLGTPQVNIAYGAYYLRYLLRRYGGNVDFALAAYNAGEGNVDRWIADGQGARARADHHGDPVLRDARLRPARAHGPRAVPAVVRRPARHLARAGSFTRVGGMSSAPAADVVTGVDFVSIPTRDLERSVAFYDETLGLERSAYRPDRNFAEFETGTVTLNVLDPERMGIGSFTPNANVIALHVDDVERGARDADRARRRPSPATPSTPASATWPSSPTPTATR